MRGLETQCPKPLFPLFFRLSPFSVPPLTRSSLVTLPLCLPPSLSEPPQCWVEDACRTWPHLLWDHQYQEYQGGHGHPGGPEHRESHVHRGNLAHPVEETAGRNQANMLGKMRWGEMGSPRTQGRLQCRETWTKLNGEKADPRRPQCWVAGHSPWDPQDQVLQLHRGCPREQKRMQE